MPYFSYFGRRGAVGRSAPGAGRFSCITPGGRLFHPVWMDWPTMIDIGIVNAPIPSFSKGMSYEPKELSQTIRVVSRHSTCQHAGRRFRSP